MTAGVALKLDRETIRFTPKGHVAVVDAIRALSGTDGPERVWERLRRRYPELDAIGFDYSFQRGKPPVRVANAEAWNRIEALLFKALVDADEAVFEPHGGCLPRVLASMRPGQHEPAASRHRPTCHVKLQRSRRFRVRG